MNAPKKPNFDMREVKSSQIHSIGHDPATGTMAICFRGRDGPGPIYHYDGVSAQQFAALLGAESVGKHFVANFRNNKKHPSRRVSG